MAAASRPAMIVQQREQYGAPWVVRDQESCSSSAMASAPSRLAGSGGFWAGSPFQSVGTGFTHPSGGQPLGKVDYTWATAQGFLRFRTFKNSLDATFDSASRVRQPDVTRQHVFGFDSTRNFSHSIRSRT